MRRLVEASGDAPAVDIVAIDNLPSLLPREASTTFSADLLPTLLELPRRTEPWAQARARFDAAVTR